MPDLDPAHDWLDQNAIRNNSELPGINIESRQGSEGPHRTFHEWERPGRRSRDNLFGTRVSSTLPIFLGEIIHIAIQLPFDNPMLDRLVLLMKAIGQQPDPPEYGREACPPDYGMVGFPWKTFTIKIWHQSGRPDFQFTPMVIAGMAQYQQILIDIGYGTSF
ncbi:hypothetical protein HYFRA_00013304 [Hymenoscyphus fraxineus]|uniref:Uncharacterized protein n=1 Tax=Hymenoscyphus fraxineus TaxID=746836 RepID=A0A9N9LAY0_9HELO|nr:hypothetical protein HYFRA_00013304 [Hymenoscyphus fraxineus]